MKTLQGPPTFEMSPLSLSFTIIPLKNHVLSEDHGELQLECAHWMSSATRETREASALKVEGRTVK